MIHLTEERKNTLALMFLTVGIGAVLFLSQKVRAEEIEENAKPLVVEVKYIIK